MTPVTKLPLQEWTVQFERRRQLKQPEAIIGAAGGSREHGDANAQIG
jgi:hypothetical protein